MSIDEALSEGLSSGEGRGSEEWGGEPGGGGEEDSGFGSASSSGSFKELEEDSLTGIPNSGTDEHSMEVSDRRGSPAGCGVAGCEDSSCKSVIPNALSSRIELIS